MEITKKKWDFFIAHASADTKEAERLYDLLTGSAKVFLDTRSIELGDNWDHVLANAQRQSLITVVLVSSSTDAAYYERVEIASAINLSRDSTGEHRVIPFYLDEASSEESNEQYGLNLKHGLFLSKTGSFEDAAYRLLETLKRIKYQKVHYDSREGAAAQFKGHPNYIWKGKGSEAKRSSPIGEGNLKIEPGGVLAVTRTKTEGRFELRLYEHESVGPKSIRRLFPASEQALEDRKLWIHCEARSDGTSHAIRFVLKNDATESWIANERRVVESTEWTEIDVFFRIDPKLDFWFRIDNEEVLKVPSRLYLRSIVIRERS